jgi:hypothetical protein
LGSLEIPELIRADFHRPWRHFLSYLHKPTDHVLVRLRRIAHIIEAALRHPQVTGNPNRVREYPSPDREKGETTSLPLLCFVHRIQADESSLQWAADL